MGVQGLAPFLLKICPEVFRELPNRLKALKGKTIVLDATLITARLHFAPVPYESRHVLGWYRLLSEFRESEVKAICVFDGKERSTAKQAESSRRRAVRDLSLARGSFERARVERLKRFHDLLWQARHVPVEHRIRDFAFMKTFSNPKLVDLSHITVDEMSRPSGLPPSGRPPFPSDGRGPTFPSVPDVSKIADFPLLDAQITGDELADVFFQLSIRDVDEPPATLSENLSEDLDTLYEVYRRSVKAFTLVEPAGQSHDVEGLENPEQTQLEMVMTKAQQDIIAREGQIWESLSPQSEELDTAMASISLLATRSAAISQSYLRRAEFPTEQTFLETKLMVEAMGVPWIESMAPYEAEGMAASLVRNGLADYVASEDTDVLVYQVPLIRNITSQAEPLVLIFGSDIPEGLHLSVPSFIDFAVLIGTDFNPRLRGLGPHRALKLIRSYDTIENVLEATSSQYTPEPRQTRAEYLERVATARSVFLDIPPAPNVDALLPRMEYDSRSVHDLLVHFGLDNVAHIVNTNKADLNTAHLLEKDFFASDRQATLEGGRVLNSHTFNL